MANLYEILGVSREANDTEIKQAYRKKVLQHHPDKGGTHDDFLLVQHAYEELLDPKSRAKYDAQLSSLASTSSINIPSNQNDESTAASSVSTVNEMIFKFANDDPAFGIVSEGSSLRDSIINYIPVIDSRLFSQDQDDIIKQLSVFQNAIINCVGRAIMLCELLKQPEKMRAEDISRVTKHRTLEKNISYLEQEIRELLNWDILIRQLHLDLALSHNPALLNSLWQENKSAVQALLESNSIPSLPVEKYELSLLAVMHPDSVKTLSVDAWGKILKRVIPVNTESGCDPTDKSRSKAKAKLANFIRNRTLQRYEHNYSQKLRDGLISHMEWLADHSHWSKSNNFFYEGYLKAGEKCADNNPFDIHLRRNLYSSEEYSSGIMDDGVGFAWNKLAECARKRDSLTPVEKISLDLLAKNLVQLCNIEYDNLDRLHHIASLLKTHSNALSEYHSKTNSFTTRLFGSEPKLKTAYDDILKEIKSRYCKSIRIEAIKDYRLTEKLEQRALSHVSKLDLK